MSEENGIVNYADKYSEKIDERFSLGSITSEAINNNYEFDGVNRVFVYSAELAELNDYDITAGTNRYGIPKELGNRVQEMKLTQDKSFTFTIDRRNNTDTMMTQHAGRSLQRHLDELIIPTVDKYRLKVMTDSAEANGNVKAFPGNWESCSKAIYGHYVYKWLLDANAELTEKKVPLNGRIVYMTPYFYTMLKLDTHYVGEGDAATKISHVGNDLMVDGSRIIVVPSEYLPENTYFLITHPSATVAPIKLAEYNINEHPQGVSGWLVEGRIYYDAFVLNNKKDAIFLAKYEVKNPEEENSEENEEENEE